MKRHPTDTLRTPKQIDARALDPDERAHYCCQRAKKFIGEGDYESASAALADYWDEIGEVPRLAGLGEATGAELLLCAGLTAGWIGGATQVEGAQAFAKDLITKGLGLYEKLGDLRGVAEAQIELAYCYWREGAGEEARILYQEAINRLADADYDLKALAFIRKAAAERTSMRSTESMNSLVSARTLIEASRDEGLKGRFHLEFANLLQSLGAAENRPDYMDQALIEYAAASYHFEQAGHARYWAHVENNLGYLFHKLGKFDDAHAHLDRALLLFLKLKDTVFAAQVRETRARTLLAQGQPAAAETTIRAALRALEKSGEQALLAEALITHGTALARLDKHDLARSTYERAIDTAAIAGSAELAGLAALELSEELSLHLPAETLIDYYLRAEESLAHSQDPAILTRLGRAARQILKLADWRRSAAEGALGGRESPPAAVTEDGRDAVLDLIEEARQRHGKRIEFTPPAVEAMVNMFWRDKSRELRTLLERTVAEAGHDATITADAVNTLALRRTPGGASFAKPWEGFSLREETRGAEAHFIALALKEASGKISVAAKLLGFPHYELLNSIIKSRHQDLLSARSPIVPRKRSIIGKRKKTAPK